MERMKHDLLETLERDKAKIQANDAVPSDDKKYLLWAIEFAINQLNSIL